MSRLFLTLLVVVAIKAQLEPELELESEPEPPYCRTRYKVGRHYEAKYMFVYPVFYVPSGTSYTSQKLYCKDKLLVYEEAKGCDWGGSPTIGFSRSSHYLMIFRPQKNNPSAGDAEIYTIQYCGHDLFNLMYGPYNHSLPFDFLPVVTKLHDGYSPIYTDIDSIYNPIR